MNRIKAIFRGFNRNRLNTSVIVISMAVGMACLFLIALFVQREFSSDDFNPDKARTFALQCDDPFGSGTGKMMHCREGSVEYMQENLVGVESFCRLWHISAKRIVANRNTYYDSPTILSASSNFFEFFHYNLISNNPQNVLVTENDIAISKDLALKYFGETLPIGKTLKTGSGGAEKEFIVSGVFEKPLETTQINFDMVTLFNGKDSRCYVKLDSPESKQKLEEDFERLKAEIPSINDGTPGQHYLQAMDDAYFSSLRKSRFEASRDKTDLWVAIAIAFLIIGIAVFNYLNLIRNRLNDNITNYTINRIQGASNKDLVRLFMTEIVGMLLISFILGVVLMKVLLPFFNELLTTNISVQIFTQFKSLLLFVLFLSVLAGISYLFALVHIRTQLSTSNIKGNSQTPRRRLPLMNVIQLASMVILVICSSIVVKQIQFINNKEIGLDKNVIEVRIPPSYKDKTSVFKEELAANPNIRNLSLTTASPLLEHWVVILNYKEDGAEKKYYPCGFTGDASYITTLGIKIREGENFSGNPDMDKRKCLINKSLADLFPNRELIGHPMPGNEENTIIGIVEDFHFSSLKRVVEPAYISFNEGGSHILVKSVEGKERQVEASIATIWNKLIPDSPLNVENMDLRYQFLHAENERFIQLIGACCLISIFLSMMGLFAISVDKCIKRIKEIGIRKVNGAKVSEILITLNQDFVKWVAIAFVIASPIAYFAMSKWLENFAYKTTLSWWIFALAGILALGIALLTVSWQSWRAATRNPVEALRYE
ncbi:ABC transporter permease [uncultured Draconibacterium sp.]|uniref:ABC transporter permease n=1 Tax=uncultured Draconibacterium sp. TaxID=1573823 RepID=UPI0029C604E7|nr:ABC transporter permease [uncultured Draconibacterium sp.]